MVFENFSFPFVKTTFSSVISTNFCCFEVSSRFSLEFEDEIVAKLSIFSKEFEEMSQTLIVPSLVPATTNSDFWFVKYETHEISEKETKIL